MSGKRSKFTFGRSQEKEGESLPNLAANRLSHRFNGENKCADSGTLL